MKIRKALIIDEPWISKILIGEKIWEMRATMASHRGPFGLIRKGSGQVIGIADLQDVSGPYSNEQLESSLCKHHVTKEVFLRPEYKWRYAWQLSNVIKLRQPVGYQHKNGAVTWVTLDEAVTSEIMHKLEEQILEQNTTETLQNKIQEESTRSAMNNQQEVKQHIDIKLTQGNINNNHFYIPRNTKLFPGDAWGGRNKSEKGENIKVHFGVVDHAIETDIDSSKRILRCRGKIGEFFRLYGLKSDDTIRIKQLVSREFLVVKA